jgi:peptide/nickel transport system ATP-binding protein
LHGEEELDFIKGQPPSLLNPPTGCRFKSRCPKRFEKCDQEPPMFNINGIKVRCWLYEENA